MSVKTRVSTTLNSVVGDTEIQHHWHRARIARYPLAWQNSKKKIHDIRANLRHHPILRCVWDGNTEVGGRRLDSEAWYKKQVLS